jgi:predicted AlkP superfamily pyrophosphatase or phosphodiesterase
LRQLAESRSTEKQYIWVYWSEIDTFSHFYAPDDERTAAEFSAFSTAFEKLFLAGLSPKTRQETLMIVTADHGQITTYKNADYELRSHPELNRHLHILPTGENRLIYLFARPGQQEAVRGYFQQTWPDLFGFLDPVYALERGLFGPGKPHPRLLERLGDLIVAARDRAYLWWADKDNFLIGRHGGFSPEEMLVPFLAFRL